MSRLRHRSSRLAWTWCLAYTAPVPREVRERRRAELRSHLWECESTGVRAPRLLSATVRGMADDVAWSCRRGWRHTVGSPEAWVAAAATFPVTGAIVSGIASAPVAQAAERTGSLGGGALLATSGVLWLARRRG